MRKKEIEDLNEYFIRRYGLREHYPTHLERINADLDSMIAQIEIINKKLRANLFDPDKNDKDTNSEDSIHSEKDVNKLSKRPSERIDFNTGYDFTTGHDIEMRLDRLENAVEQIINWLDEQSEQENKK